MLKILEKEHQLLQKLTTSDYILDVHIQLKRHVTQIGEDNKPAKHTSQTVANTNDQRVALIVKNRDNADLIRETDPLTNNTRISAASPAMPPVGSLQLLHLKYMYHQYQQQKHLSQLYRQQHKLRPHQHNCQQSYHEHHQQQQQQNCNSTAITMSPAKPATTSIIAIASINVSTFIRKYNEAPA
ncbi:sodium- and chloride-dependent betaine transporter [Plakobranchus ocellatus]|uniref:Sodium- and chloride-dependent betaine transporter n=1 Tax=Plakobranchus ocellatus TaxID=259542 RepID=A0AAV4DJC5_9GAST|nr:sodium- and chloride-dependent betaine transporter [Plakobranchus ocellatus]